MNMDIRLSDLNQWVAWVYGRKIPTTGKRQKVPINPRTGRAAVKTNPAHWGTLAEARERARRDRLEGIGICLTVNDPFLCIDLDDAIIDGKPSALAAELMGHFDTYTEYSPSGDGLHIWIKSDEQINRDMKNKAGIEIYSHAIYMTWTGKPYPFTPNKINAGSVSWLVERYDPKPEATAQPATQREYLPAPASDQALWELIIDNDEKDRIERLRDGDISVARSKKTGKPDPSLAVLMLLNTLAKYTRGDQARMRRMIEQTALPKDKWTDKRGDSDWLTWRIADACAYMGV